MNALAVEEDFLHCVEIELARLTHRKADALRLNNSLRHRALLVHTTISIGFRTECDELGYSRARRLDRLQITEERPYR